VTIKDSITGNGLQGALVSVKVSPPSGSLPWTSLGVTGLGGTKSFIYIVAPNNPKGTYNVAATTTLPGYPTGTAQTTFNVI